jgi:hypothetical protein
MIDDELYIVWNTLNDAVPFTTKSPLMFALPVTPSEPVINAEPVNGNGEIYPSKYDAVSAYDAVVELFEYDDDVDESACEALTAYDADMVFCANDAVVE